MKETKATTTTTIAVKRKTTKAFTGISYALAVEIVVERKVGSLQQQPLEPTITARTTKARILDLVAIFPLPSQHLATRAIVSIAKTAPPVAETIAATTAAALATRTKKATEPKGTEPLR